ncbi:hypothetical protein [Stenotrophomonas oahuensis]|uniref:Uncharacterized protein n=1 Tax=Stenotrophomonas oahuensis TaxID=3003271 RepID=A0ABY9YT22_9GAMM|nr:hypothetical protein [Stenotrophomonas sp. A5586]WNH53868.1 hypothetical protein PDM29_06195 [Stenotrophomonas sp. A5586]
MVTEIREFREMLESGQRYLHGACSIQELYGSAAELATAAKFVGGHSAIAQIARDWTTMIDRFWNEWGHHSNPVNEQEFRAWLTAQLKPEPRS